MSRLSIDIERLLQSETWRDCQANHPADACYHITLWLEAVRQKPAGSIPSDDEAIRRLAGCKSEWWEKIRARVLRKWVLSADGNRLFHPVVVETMNQRTRSRVLKKTDDYSPEFEAFWSVCLKNHMGGSKLEAWHAWQENKPPRPQDAALIWALNAYVADVLKKDSKFVHPCRFLSKAYWEAYPQAVQSAPQIVHPSWNGKAQPLIDAIGGPQFEAWFGDAQFADGTPPHIIAATPMKKRWIESHFGPQLRKQFGDDVVCEAT